MRSTHSRSAAFVAPVALAGILLVSASPWVGFGPALAATAKDAPTCEQLKEKCLAHIRKREANTKAPPETEGRPHLQAEECYANYSKARETGVWPEHLPLNFAIACTN